MRTAPLAALLILLAACDSKTSSPNPTTPPPGTGTPTASGTGAPAADLPKGDTTYYFGVKESLTTVTFQSKNDLTDILGSTHNVAGSATINFEGGRGTCDLSVPAATLNSGMADRDRAMMGVTWLNVKQFPTIEFKAEKATLTDKPHGWTVDGKFTLRGVTKDMTVKVDVRPLPAAIGTKLGIGDGPCIKVKTSFKVKLADHGIEIPSTAVATVQPEISVTIDIMGSTVKPANAPVVKAPDTEEGPIKVIRAPKVSEEGIEGVKYAFGKKPQLTQLTATSETDIEKVMAVTKVVGGILGLDKDKGTAKVRLALPVDSLRTSIDARDEHLRGPDWLDFAKFKTIEFESTKAVKKDDKTWSVEGNFTMHGVTKPVSTVVTIREIPVEMIQKAHWGETPGLGFAASFKVKLSDFGVKIPEIAVAKVNDEWTVTIDLVALQKE